MLEVVGLSSDQQRLYEQLLAWEPSTLAELEQAVAGRPWASQLKPMLAALEELGLLAWQPEDPPRCLVVQPDAAFDTLIAAQSRALVEARQRVHQLTARFYGTSSRRDPLELVEVIFGHEEILQRWEEVQRSARHEVCAFDAPPYVTQPVTDGNPIEPELLRNGISYRTLYDRRALDPPGRLADIEHAIADGEIARVSDLPMKLILSDAPLALLPLRTDPIDTQTALVVQDSALLEALQALFEMYWERAIPLHIQQESPRRRPGEPSDVERKLLPLLLAGLTDRAIAAHLGQHERTVRHHVQRMMIKLDCTTRFQAGYQAVLRGWLTDDQDARHGS